MLKLIENYLNELKANKLSSHAIENYRKTLELLNAYKPIEKITSKEDLVGFFSQLNVSESSVKLHQTLIKKYFRDQGKPELVNWIKVKKVKEKLRADQILTSEDINRMIETSENHYVKALIAFLFEVGPRISEARALKYKDCVETTEGMEVHIPTTKTDAGYRKVILPFSAQYIRNLKIYVAGKPEDYIFPLGETRTYIILQEAACKAGITKPVSPHMFRHAQATDMVRRGYNETIMRKKLGWTKTSNVPARYIHITDDDVINATLEMAGKAAPKNRVLEEIKEAEKITLVDAAMQFSKLTEENQQLKERLSKLEAERKQLGKEILAEVLKVVQGEGK